MIGENSPVYEVVRQRLANFSSGGDELPEIPGKPLNTPPAETGRGSLRRRLLCGQAAVMRSMTYLLPALTRSMTYLLLPLYLLSCGA